MDSLTDTLKMATLEQIFQGLKNFLFNLLEFSGRNFSKTERDAGIFATFCLTLFELKKKKTHKSFRKKPKRSFEIDSTFLGTLCTRAVCFKTEVTEKCSVLK